MGNAKGAAALQAALQAVRPILEHYVKVIRRARFFGLAGEEPVGMDGALELEAVLDEGRELLTEAWLRARAEWARLLTEEG